MAPSTQVERMRRSALYSSASKTAAASRTSAPAPAPASSAPLHATPAATPRHWSAPAPRYLWAAIGLLALALLASLWLPLRPSARAPTQKDIDAAVLHTLANTTLPSPAAKAYEAIRPSVVRVVSYATDPKTRKETERGVGTGVVIVDKGVILTNLHVVAGAEKIKVTFFDGLESTASITGVQAENDLAVLQAHKIPDDLQAATLRSTADLAPGDRVMAVGFPFGIGPSASEGIVSGLKRNFRSPEGKQEMTNLIQFDAAANPGNSGGPLVTMDGEVVGIVTAILNPTQARTFIGIGFAVPIENAASAAGMPPF
jgi:serine protease DegQ